jgi:N utilization substance protein B
VAQRAPSRKQARRDAVFLLYQREVTSLAMEELVVGHKLREGYPPDDYTVAAVRGVIEHTAELDAELGAHTRDWRVARIAPLERSILRLALWELRHTDTPPQVAIDEAVRLTKRYSTDDSARFVNGVLGGIVGHSGAGDEQPVNGALVADEPEDAVTVLQGAEDDDTEGDETGGEAARRDETDDDEAAPDELDGDESEEARDA